MFYQGERGECGGAGKPLLGRRQFGPFANRRTERKRLLWAFFQQHPFSPGQAPSVAITYAVAEGTTVRVKGDTADADGTVIRVEVRLDGAVTCSRVVAQGTTSWSATFDNVPDNTLYNPVVTAVDNDGLQTAVTGSPVPVGTLRVNTPPNVSITHAEAALDCITVEGNASDPVPGYSRKSRSNSGPVRSGRPL